MSWIVEKPLLVIVLGTVIIGILGFAWLKTGPSRLVAHLGLSKGTPIRRKSALPQRWSPRRLIMRWWPAGPCTGTVKRPTPEAKTP